MRKNYFWGLLLIILGVTFILRKIFNINISVGTLIFSFIFIFWGVSMLVGKPSNKASGSEGYKQEYKNDETAGGFNKQSHNDMHKENKRHERNDMLFSSGEIKATNLQDKYDVVFSNSIIDLTTLPVPLTNRNLKIDTVFSKSILKINPEVPAVIKISSVFAGAHLPNNTTITFGDYTYVTRSYREGLPYLHIKADVVFGNMDVIEVTA